VKSKPTLQEIRDFWERNPLFVGESRAPLGSATFFDEHRRVYVEDCFAGMLDPRLFPNDRDIKVFDAGCGVGMWSAEFARRGYRSVKACDLTMSAAITTRIRVASVKSTGEFDVFQGNIEELPLGNEIFDYINCQGVLHHTPDPERAIREFNRILRPGGTMLVSVYFRGIPLRLWSRCGSLMSRLSVVSRIGLAGRGRAALLTEVNTEELVRKYDGEDNPLGIAYDRNTFCQLLAPFEIEEIFLHSFPARAMPIRIPHVVHRFLDRYFGLLIFAQVRKRVANDSVLDQESEYLH